MHEGTIISKLFLFKLSESYVPIPPRFLPPRVPSHAESVKIMVAACCWGLPGQRLRAERPFRCPKFSSIHTLKYFKFILFWFGGYIRWFSGLTPTSELRDHSWGALGSLRDAGEQARVGPVPSLLHCGSDLFVAQCQPWGGASSPPPLLVLTEQLWGCRQVRG